ncbi:unnamed protein product [marine sediment metagenome]|uniref:Uncharacterized protein n=1 Tax=marine sediment metagenome TaxID=412755 RepID=X0SID1_9ZZZZ
MLIVKLGPDDDLEHTRYWATSRPAAWGLWSGRLDDTLEQVVGHAAEPRTIEVLFADFKELMRSDH